MQVLGIVNIKTNIEKIEGGVVHIHDGEVSHEQAKTDRYRYAEEAEIIEEDVPEAVKKEETAVEKTAAKTQDWTNHPFYPYLTNPNQASFLLPRLKVAIAMKNLQRDKLLLVRSLYETGNLTKIPLCKEYNSAYTKIQSSTYSKWMGPTNKYSNEEIETALQFIQNMQV